MAGTGFPGGNQAKRDKQAQIDPRRLVEVHLERKKGVRRPKQFPEKSARKSTLHNGWVEYFPTAIMQYVHTCVVHLSLPFVVVVIIRSNGWRACTSTCMYCLPTWERAGGFSHGQKRLNESEWVSKRQIDGSCYVYWSVDTRALHALGVGVHTP